MTIFADNGTPIEALRLISSGQTNQVYDINGNLRSTSNTVVDKNTYDCVADCHGYTFAENVLWINDDQVQKILDNDDYYENVDESIANVVIFKKDGSVVHSGKRNKNGTYNNNAGILKTEYQVTLDQASRGLTDTKDAKNILFVERCSPDKVVKTTYGKVGKGMRTITNQWEMKQILKQLKL